MPSMLRIAACAAVAVSALAVGAGSASANTVTAGTGTAVTSPAAGGAVADLLGTLQGLIGLHGEPEWS